MLNAIALQLMNFLLRGPMLDPEQIAAGTNIAQSEALPRSIWLLRLVPPTLLHAGVILAAGAGRACLLPALAHDHRLPHPHGRA
jgi:ABC-type uncharacterized transport system permease subunit